MLKEEDNSDMSQDEFDDLVSREIKHREIVEAINEVAKTLNTEGDNSEVKELLSSNKEITNSFIDKLKSLSKDNNNELINNSKLLNKTFTNIEKLLSEKKEWNFEITRDRIGRLVGVKAVQTN